MTRHINDAGLQLIKGFESLRLFAYPDPASPLATATRGKRWGFESARDILATLPADKANLDGSPWTVGYGHTKGVTPDTRCDEALADRWLKSDVDVAEATISRLVKVPLTDNQFSALVSWCFNCGPSAAERSTLIKKLNKYDYSSVPSELNKWVYAGKKKLSGLVTRRSAEAGLFVKDEVASPSAVTVQPKTLVDSDNAGNISTAVGVAGASLTEAASELYTISPYLKAASIAFVILLVAGVALKLYATFNKIGNRSDD